MEDSILQYPREKKKLLQLQTKFGVMVGAECQSL